LLGPNSITKRIKTKTENAIFYINIRLLPFQDGN
jgi:hypothetical protein